MLEIDELKSDFDDNIDDSNSPSRSNHKDFVMIWITMEGFIANSSNFCEHDGP